ncbi:citrate lyase subunit alpha [Caproiciproducens sp. NJN-50]|uniref:citrate lyase subunit alpha n=1 Tax=Caproiciproducens sp. NJN-50 TaxID=2507162 RepID=UPI000FFDF845|nr:citrate lyase subunit alpha [Caproiciproducens sp. NJN-50]QAT48760.1 citrate lyase subunit alpha [Caproiciproducens sp. NJN-50]
MTLKTDLEQIPHADELNLTGGLFAPDGVKRDTDTHLEREKNHSKVVGSLEEAVRLSGLKNGMTISFHHHFRNGDYIVNMVLDKLAEMGFRDMVLAASSLTDCHAPLIRHVKSGVIRRIETSGLRGELGEAVSKGLMDVPVVFRSHGGRAYAVETGKLPIDVAFLGAPSCDPYGNANGYSRENDNGIMCGSMGYAKCDAQYAEKTVVITNNIVPYPNTPFGIPESDVDYIVEVPEIGDPDGIMSGATRFTKNPKELLIAETAAGVIEASGRFQDGFSIQMGSGGASLAVARFLREKMLAQKIKASFALGGITGSVVDLYDEGLVKKILDVQSFDLKAAQSLKNNRFHQQISASYYASPGNMGTAVNQLDVVVLSALEVDCGFNVNVLTGSNGVIRGAIGGHPDTAFGASVSIVVVPLTRGRIPCVVSKVNTVVTPGSTVDVVVTDQGTAVNPRRKELAGRLAAAGLPVCTIGELRERAERIVGKPEPVEYTDRVVGVVTYRDGSVIDLIRQVKD